MAESRFLEIEKILQYNKLDNPGPDRVGSALPVVTYLTPSLMWRHFYGEPLYRHDIQGFKRATNKTLFCLSEIINF